MNNQNNDQHYKIEGNKISFYRDFIEPLDDYLYLIQQCEEVWFVNTFNQSINNLPDNIKKITIENTTYDKPINKLPDNLEAFTFHTEFYDFPNNKLFDFPKTLKHLGWYCFGCTNLKITIDMFPKTLLSLTLGIEFENSDLYYFSNLKELTIDICDFNQSLDNLPNTIEKLTIISDTFDLPLDNLPNLLKELHFHSNSYSETSTYEYSFDTLPISLEKLTLPANYKGNLDNLPQGLKYLEIKDEFEGSVNNLPDSLEVLEWISIYDYKGQITKIPANLKEVIFGHNYETRNMKQKIRKMLLRNTKIKITDMFDVE